MAIFNSYVKLPEGMNIDWQLMIGLWTTSKFSNGLLIECWSMIQMINIGDDRSTTGCCDIYIYIIYTGWWFGTFFIFPFSWECHNPNWLIIIFQRGQPPTRLFFSVFIQQRLVRWFQLAWDTDQSITKSGGAVNQWEGKDSHFCRCLTCKHQGFVCDCP